MRGVSVATIGVLASILWVDVADSASQRVCRPGDVVVGAWDAVSQRHNSILGITPQGQVYTLVSHVPFMVYSITTSENNRGLLAAGRNFVINGPALARVALDGTVTSLFAGPNQLDFVGLDVDGGGNVILAHSGGWPAGFSVIKFTGGVATTLYSAQQIPRIAGAGIDLRSGDLIAGGFHSSQPSLWTLMRATLTGSPSVASLAPLSGLPGGSFLMFPRNDPVTDTSIVGYSFGRIDRVSLRSPGKPTTLSSGPPLGTLAMSPSRDPRDGRLVIPTYDASPWPPLPPRVLRFDPVQRTFQVVTTLSGVVPQSATVAGRRHLCGGNDVRPGQAYAMLVSSPAEPGATYAVALAFDFFPGFRLPDGRTICLDPDPLFVWSLTGTGPFSGFHGSLDARGEAIATVTIPRIPALSGWRFFASTITVVNNRVSVISDPVGVTIQ